MKLFDITQNAKDQMSKMLAKHPNKYAVGLSVKGGGCAGFQYEWSLIDNADQLGKEDHLEEWEGGRFVVDEISLLYVSGTKIDWKEELFGSQFEISNPNSNSACGCGESFGI